MKTLMIALLLSSIAGCLGTTVHNPGDPSSDRSVNDTVEPQGVKLRFGVFSLGPSTASSAIGCFKRVRFEDELGSPGAGGFDLDLDMEVDLSPGGTELTNITLEPGTYQRVTLEIEDECSTGRSFETVNDNGTFDTDQDAEIVFTGLFVISANSKVVTLGISPLMEALADVESDNDLEDVLEQFEGEFEEEDDDDSEDEDDD